MRVQLPQISTHTNEGGGARNEPINSVDAHPKLPVVATGGAGDNRVVLWRLGDGSGNERGDWVECLCELLTTNDSTVNVVRFSPDGRVLASADDDGVVCLSFVRGQDSAAAASTTTTTTTTTTTADQVTWLDVKEELQLGRVVLRGGHGEKADVLDVAWSPDSRLLATASVDNTVVVWDTTKPPKNALVARLEKHKNFVQGVAFSPDGRYLASQSSDQTVRVYRIGSLTSKRPFEPVATLRKPQLFQGDTVPTFMRRLAFSPGAGSLLVAPTGQLPRPSSTATSPPTTTTTTTTSTTPAAGGGSGKVLHAAHVFAELVWRGRNTQAPPAGKSGSQAEVAGACGPLASLAGFKRAPIAVRFHPSEFEMDASPDAPTAWAPIQTKAGKPCRAVFAVATLDAVVVYDTQRAGPLAVAENLHLANLTDVAWHVAANGDHVLLVTSMDGYFTMLRFEERELGVAVAAPAPAPAPAPAVVPAPAPVAAAPAVVATASTPEGDAKRARVEDATSASASAVPLAIDEASRSSTASVTKRRVPITVVQPMAVPVTSGVTVLAVRRKPAASTTTSTTTPATTNATPTPNVDAPGPVVVFAVDVDDAPSA